MSYWAKDTRELVRQEVTVLIVGALAMAALGLAILTIPTLLYLWVVGLV